MLNAVLISGPETLNHRAPTDCRLLTAPAPALACRNPCHAPSTLIAPQGSLRSLVRSGFSCLIRYRGGPQSASRVSTVPVSVAPNCVVGSCSSPRSQQSHAWNPGLPLCSKFNGDLLGGLQRYRTAFFLSHGLILLRRLLISRTSDVTTIREPQLPRIHFHFVCPSLVCSAAKGVAGTSSSKARVPAVLDMAASPCLGGLHTKALSPT
jgi:hypothetical protein